jgi:hypothetical protein
VSSEEVESGYASRGNNGNDRSSERKAELLGNSLGRINVGVNTQNMNVGQYHSGYESRQRPRRGERPLAIQQSRIGPHNRHEQCMHDDTAVVKYM